MALTQPQAGATLGMTASPFFHRKCTVLSISIECEILQPGMKALVLLVNAKQCINLNVSFARFKCSFGS